MPGEGSFLARFALKFAEVVAAGVATAVSGYVIAHLAAPMFSATAPTAAPRPAANITTNDGAPHPPSKPDAAPVEPAAAVPAAPASSKIPPTKSKPVETRAVQGVPGGPASRRPPDAGGRKPDAALSLEARVRAALARSNGRTALAGAPRRHLLMPSAAPNFGPDVEHRAPAAAVAASPAEDAGSSAEAPRAAALSPPRLDIAPLPGGQNPDGQNIATQNPAEPDVQKSAIALTPLTTVVVKPQPSLGAGAGEPLPSGAQAQASHDDKRDGGPFSAFARILRSDRPLPQDEVPRPPNAVGQ